MLNLGFQRADAGIVPTHAVFGKLHNRPDFVRVNANHPVALEVDALIQRVLEKMHADPAEAARFAQGGAVDFMYVARDQRQVMTGVLVPSHDVAGRAYPLVAAAVLPCEPLGCFLPVLPIAYEVFFDGLREQVLSAVDNSVEALACREFLEASLRGSGTDDEDLQLANSVIQRFMSQEGTGYLTRLLAQDEGQPSLHQALLNIAFYQDYLRRFDNRATNQLIRLPLPEASGEQALLASAWLSLLASLWPTASSAGAWRGSYLITRRSGEAPQLVVSAGSMPDSFVHILLGGRVDGAVRLDLERDHEAWRSHRMYAEASYALGRVLADPDFRLTQLSRFLGDMSRQLEGNS